MWGALGLLPVLAAVLPDWPGAAPSTVLCALCAAWGTWEAVTLAGSTGFACRGAAALSAAFACTAWALGSPLAAPFLLLPGAAALACVLASGDTSRAGGLAGAGWMGALWAFGAGSAALLRAASPDPWMMVLPLACCWAGDSAAYFTGMAVGRHRMAPSISPAKTWEGFAGGVAASTGAGLLVGTLGCGFDPAVSAAAGAACGLAGAAGDLVESAYKRWAGVKDSGRLLPGHGGMLDRTDSVVAAAPAALLVLRAAGVLP
jgi:phosphatidate cytidylyltransferase